jgi:hypothetical protein
MQLFVNSPEFEAMVKEYQAQEVELITRIKSLKDKPTEQAEVRVQWLNYVTNLGAEKYLNPAFLENIPDASIVNFVTPGWKLKKDDKVVTELDIGHQALLFKKDGRLMMREASGTFKKVIDIPFASVLVMKMNSATQKGVNFQSVHRKILD